MDIVMFISLIGFLVMFMIRNTLVAQYRLNIIDAMYQLSKAEIHVNKFKASVAKHRRDEFERVSYDRMVLMFWRRIGSFYDEDFLKELGIK